MFHLTLYTYIMQKLPLIHLHILEVSIYLNASSSIINIYSFRRDHSYSGINLPCAKASYVEPQAMLRRSAYCEQSLQNMLPESILCTLKEIKHLCRLLGNEPYKLMAKSVFCPKTLGKSATQLSTYGQRFK